MNDIFIGIDVHQKQSFYCALNHQGHCLGHESMMTEREALRELIRRYQPEGPVHVALETGGSTWWVAQVLRDCGADIYPVNARELKLIAHSKRKTDKYDSRVLADLLRCNGLPERVHMPSEAIVRLRSQLKLRKWIVRQRAQTVVRAKALMRQVGISAVGRTFATSASWVRFIRDHSEWENLLQPMYEIWLKAGEQLKVVETMLVDTLPETEEQMAILMTIPGVGPVSARTLIAAVDDIRRFERSGQLVSYAGLVPSENSSGERHQMGSITKRGRSELRDAYVQAAWAVLRSPRPETAGLKKFFYRIMHKRCSQVAIVALAKKLLVISYYVLKQRVPFAADRYVDKAA